MNYETDLIRFRSLAGSIYSANPNATSKKITISRARLIMNELYNELAKYDKESAENICRNHNA